MKSCKLIWLAGCAGLAPLRPLAVEPAYLVDQRHDLPDAYEAYHSIQTYSPVQEFVPAIAALGAVEIWTLDLGYPYTNGMGATLQAVLRADSINGAVLEMSEPLVLPDSWDAPARFRFKEQLSLAQGQRYAVEVRVLEGDNWGVRSFGQLFPSYSAGRYFLSGTALSAFDMWFRTLVQLPPPTVSLDSAGTLRWLGVPPLSYRVWSSTDLRNWTNIGTAQSATSGYAFTNAPLNSERRFFRVSCP